MTSTLVIIQASEINAPIGTYVYASINDNTHTTKGKIWQFWGPTTSHDELMRWDWWEIFCYGWIEQLTYFDKKKLRMTAENPAKNIVKMKRLLFSNTKNEALFGCLAVLFIYVQKTSTCLIRPKGFFSSSFLSSVCKYRPKKWCTNIRFGFMVQDKKSKKEYVFFMLLSLSTHAVVV